ncbi:hypothetical protein ACFE04_031431 [Oxalis oulophora]
MEGRKTSSCHPVLRGGRREEKFTHGFSSAQLQSLAALSEALIEPFHDQQIPSTQPPIPDEVAAKLAERAPKDGKILVNIALKLLSFKLGTLLLCGRLCIDRKWPIVHSFSELPVERREEIVKTWSKTKFVPLRAIFVMIKVFTFLTYFSRTDENLENPTWKAMGYKRDTRERKTPPTDRPLEKGIVESSQESNSTILQSLIQKGLDVIEDPQQGVYNIKCDAVVIGSGCGGGVAAAVLASSGQKVLVLEKGKYFVAKDYSSLEVPSMDQLYEAGGCISTVDGKFAIFAGSTVGGGSAVNWSASIKTPDHVLKDWAVDHKIPLYGSSEYQNAMDTNNSSGKRENKCLGVIAHFSSGNVTKKLHIEAKVTISACGSLNTPPLLVSSGLQNPNIGRNLHLHPVLVAWGYFPENKAGHYKGTSYEGGIITLLNKVVSEESGEVRAIVQTISLGPAASASITPWVSRQDFKERVSKYSRMAQLFTLVRDKGCGEVRSEGVYNYKLDQVDKENLKHGLRRVLRIMIAAGAVEVGTNRSDGQRFKCEGTTEEEIEEFLDSITAEEGLQGGGECWTNYFSAHQMGSCRMGVTEKDGALDSNGESWDAEGLFVCDGSVLPTAIGVNPMITIESTSYCIAKKIAESMKTN